MAVESRSWQGGYSNIAGSIVSALFSLSSKTPAVFSSASKPDGHLQRSPVLHMKNIAAPKY